MSTSTSLSSAKRRRAGAAQELQNSVISSNTVEQPDDGSRMMTVQNVLYMFHNKLETLASKVSTNTSLDNGDVMTQITDSIDNMNSTLEEFSNTLQEFDARLDEVEKNTQLAEKVQLLEKRINEKILSKTAEKAKPLQRKSANNTTKAKLDEIPNKKGNTVNDKFVDKLALKKEQLKAFEEKQKESESENNMTISFTGLKDKIETNNDDEVDE